MSILPEILCIHCDLCSPQPRWSEFQLFLHLSNTERRGDLISTNVPSKFVPKPKQLKLNKEKGDWLFLQSVSSKLEPLETSFFIQILPSSLVYMSYPFNSWIFWFWFDLEMEEKHEDVDDVGSASGDSFIDDSEDDGPSTSGKDDQFHLEASDISFSICICEVLVSLVASCLASQ